MNQQVQAMIAGFKTGVENALSMISDESKTAELKKVYEEMMALAEEHGDNIATFVNKANGANLFNRISAELQKANENLEKQQSDPETAKAAGIEDLKRNYENLYEQIKASPRMKETAKVYEEILALADEINEVTAWQQALYEKGLIHKIGAMTLYDNAEFEHARKDPNDTLLLNLNKEKKEIAGNGVSGDEMLYKDLKASVEYTSDVVKDRQIFYFIEKLFIDLLEFYDTKAIVRREKIERDAEYLLDLKYIREDIKSLYSTIQEFFGLDFDAIVSNPDYVKRLFYVGMPIEGSDRIWIGQAPSNIEFFKSLLFNEVLADISLTELIMKKPEIVYSPPGEQKMYIQDGLHEKWLQWVKGHAEKYEWADIIDEEVEDSLNGNTRLKSYMHLDELPRREKGSRDVVFDTLLEVNHVIDMHKIERW